MSRSELFNFSNADLLTAGVVAGSSYFLVQNDAKLAAVLGVSGYAGKKVANMLMADSVSDNWVGKISADDVAGAVAVGAAFKYMRPSVNTNYTVWATPVIAYLVATQFTEAQ